MGALYIIVGMVAAGLALDALSAIIGEGKAEEYDYNFALGVGAVFGSIG